ncbi:MAG TPA: dienelactone hydrolase family protein [Myxococcales bacterium]|nr:dienelactone hydrolase family protein [Myxococcales bacterium]
MSVRSDSVSNAEIETPRGKVPAYVARPQQGGPWPGVVVLHDAFGMTTGAKRHVDGFASRGFIAASPSLFHDTPGGMMKCVRAAMREVAARSGPMFDDIEATRGWLARQPGCSGKIGVIGFCMSGGFAIALAPTGKYAASSVNYGTLPPDAETFLNGACPMVASYGGKDRRLRGSAARLETILTASKVPHDVKEYPEAGHGFMEDHVKSELPWLFVKLAPLMDAGYHEAAAHDAHERVAAFFGKHLGAAT